MPATFVRSATVVIEAAMFLIADGVLNIPDVGIMNVKQCRAFLLNSIWLQEYMNRQWELESASPHGDQYKEFVLALTGPGGTGKTAVLKATEALITYFAL